MTAKMTLAERLRMLQSIVEHGRIRTCMVEAADALDLAAKALEPWATAAEFVDDPSWSDTDQLQVFLEDVLLFDMKVRDLRAAATAHAALQPDGEGK